MVSGDRLVAAREFIMPNAKVDELSNVFYSGS